MKLQAAAIIIALAIPATIWGEARYQAAQVAPFTCDTDAECAALPPCALKPGCDGSPATEPFRLVGYGCEGASGPLYRDEEDEFPEGGCAAIEATF